MNRNAYSVVIATEYLSCRTLFLLFALNAYLYKIINSVKNGLKILIVGVHI